MIDVHTHPVMIKELVDTDPGLWKSTNEVFGFKFPPQPLSIFLMEMDEAGIDKAVLLPVDCTTRFNCYIVTNEQVAELCGKTPRFIGFASVDPGRVDAPRVLERAILKLGLRGLKLDPALQGFDLNDKDHAYPLYQICSELNIPLIVHCGLSWTPSGIAQYAQPLLLEEIAQKYPELRVIIAHFGWPWVSEAAMLAIKYPNIFIDTAILYSGTPSDAYKRVMNFQIGLDVIERSLFDKVIFGSNYPRVDIRRSVRAVQNLGLSEGLFKRVMSENAKQVLAMEGI
jgi:predicted TIM-barrel fold metal-dependent hydrolase